MAASAKRLREAIENQAKSLDPAQREFVLTEFETFKWNAKQIKTVQKSIRSEEISQDEKSKLIKLRHQLVTEQSALFGHIMRWLKGTAVEQSEFDKFLEG